MGHSTWQEPMIVNIKATKAKELQYEDYTDFVIDRDNKFYPSIIAFAEHKTEGNEELRKECLDVEFDAVGEYARLPEHAFIVEVAISRNDLLSGEFEFDGIKEKIFDTIMLCSERTLGTLSYPSRLVLLFNCWADYDEREGDSDAGTDDATVLWQSSHRGYVNQQGVYHKTVTPPSTETDLYAADKRVSQPYEPDF